MAGQVIGVSAEAEQKITTGDSLVSLSAMKMETTVSCAVDGVAWWLTWRSRPGQCCGNRGHFGCDLFRLRERGRTGVARVHNDVMYTKNTSISFPAPSFQTAARLSNTTEGT